jgi:predicted metal-dependent hydrolase
MKEMDCSAPLPSEARRGLQLFNAGEYFEAHEALENAWRAESGSIRLLYQAILQVAVTYLHIQRGNYEGAIQLAARAMPKLEKWPPACRGVDVAGLRRDFATILEKLTSLGPEGIDAFDTRLFNTIKYED